MLLPVAMVAIACVYYGCIAVVVGVGLLFKALFK